MRARGGQALAAVLTAAALAVTGCGQAGQSGHSTPASHQPTASGGPFGGKTPVGTQLGSLLTHAHLPAGWGPVTNAGRPEIDSGSQLGSPSGPQSGEDSCTTLGISVQASDFADWWAVSSASLVVQYNPGSADVSIPIANLTVAAYQPADDAARTLSTVTSLADSCRSFTDSSGDSVTVRSAAIPQISSQSLYLSSTAQTSSAGPIVAQVLLAHVGSYVIGVDTNTATGGNVSQATVEQLSAWLARLVQSS
jgi:hypothetical protein